MTLLSCLGTSFRKKLRLLDPLPPNAAENPSCCPTSKKDASMSLESTMEAIPCSMNLEVESVAVRTVPGDLFVVAEMKPSSVWEKNSTGTSFMSPMQITRKPSVPKTTSRLRSSAFLTILE